MKVGKRKVSEGKTESEIPVTSLETTELPVRLRVADLLVDHRRLDRLVPQVMPDPPNGLSGGFDQVAEPSGDQLAGDAVAERIPVPAARRRVRKPVQVRVVLLGVALERLC